MSIKLNPNPQEGGTYFLLPFPKGFCNGPDVVGRCQRSTFLHLPRTSIGLVRANAALLSLVDTNWVRYTGRICRCRRRGDGNPSRGLNSLEGIDLPTSHDDSDPLRWTTSKKQIMRSLRWPSLEGLNVGAVPTFKMHNIGTVSLFKMHNVGTVHTYKTHNIRTELSYATLDATIYLNSIK
jgi:hypothetical protein